jgi:hypothetical protein
MIRKSEWIISVTGVMILNDENVYLPSVMGHNYYRNRNADYYYVDEIEYIDYDTPYSQ